MASPSAYGIVFPFQRDGRGDFNKAGIHDLVRASIQQILGVRGSGPTTQGELPWRTAFGSQVYRIRHANNDAALEDIVRYFVVDILAIYEPRIRLAAVSIKPEVVSGFGERSGLITKVGWKLRSSPVSSEVETTEVIL